MSDQKDKKIEKPVAKTGLTKYKLSAYLKKHKNVNVPIGQKLVRYEIATLTDGKIDTILKQNPNLEKHFILLK